MLIVTGIINCCFLKVRQKEMSDWLFLTSAYVLGVGSHFVGGGNEKPFRDCFPVALTKELIYVGFSDVIFLGVALCLNGPGLTVAVLEY